MKYKLLLIVLSLSQCAAALDKPDTQKLKKVEGCVYADIIYQPGEKHRVQQSVTDPVTKKVTMVDLEPKIVQECVEDTTAEKTKSPRFYWITLPN